jgi:hypothetical protein
MKKTLIIATAAGLALSSGIEETQDNELIMNSIKNGYYTVSNAILSRPAMIAGGMQMIQNGMARPTFLNHFDEAADDEFMAKGHGEHGHKQKGDKKKNGKKNRPQPAQPAQEVQQPIEQAQDNNLAFEDDNLALEDYQDDELIMNSIKNGYYTVSNAILSRPAMIAGGMQMIQNGMARPTFLNHFDEAADDEFMAKGHGEHGHKQKGDKKKNGKKNRPQPAQPVQEVQQPIEQAQDNNLAFEDDNFAIEDYQDDELMAKGHGAHGEHGQKQKGDKKKNGKKHRPQPAQEAQPVDQAQDNILAFEDDNFALEDYQDDELIMNSIKNGYYTVSNAILSRPAMIAGGMQMIQNGMARPTFINHFDENADDEFAAHQRTEKTEKPRKHRQPLERPDDVIRKNHKLRVPKDIAADNTLFDLAELLEDN